MSTGSAGPNIDNGLQALFCSLANVKCFYFLLLVTKERHKENREKLFSKRFSHKTIERGGILSLVDSRNHYT